MLLPNIDTFGPPLRGHLGAGKSDQRYMIQQPQALANPGSLGMIKDRNESMNIQTHWYVCKRYLFSSEGVFDLPAGCV